MKSSQIVYIVSAFLVLVVLTLAYLFKQSFYPEDEFYFSEFTKVTNKEVPKSSKIISKDISSWDLHGDYCSACVIKVSLDDYSSLYNELMGDVRMSRSNEIVRSDQLDNVMKNFRYEDITTGFTRVDPLELDSYYYIGFMNDKTTIAVSVCDI